MDWTTSDNCQNCISLKKKLELFELLKQKCCKNDDIAKNLLTLRKAYEKSSKVLENKSRKLVDVRSKLKDVEKNGETLKRKFAEFQLRLVSADSRNQDLLKDIANEQHNYAILLKEKQDVEDLLQTKENELASLTLISKQLEERHENDMQDMNTKMENSQRMITKLKEQLKDRNSCKTKYDKLVASLLEICKDAVIPVGDSLTKFKRLIGRLQANDSASKLEAELNSPSMTPDGATSLDTGIFSGDEEPCLADDLQMSSESSDDDFEDVQSLAMRIGKVKSFKDCLSTTSSSYALPESRARISLPPDCDASFSTVDSIGDADNTTVDSSSANATRPNVGNTSSSLLQFSCFKVQGLTSPATSPPQKSNKHPSWQRAEEINVSNSNQSHATTCAPSYKSTNESCVGLASSVDSPCSEGSDQTSEKDNIMSSELLSTPDDVLCNKSTSTDSQCMSTLSTSSIPGDHVCGSASEKIQRGPVELEEPCKNFAGVLSNMPSTLSTTEEPSDVPTSTVESSSAIHCTLLDGSATASGEESCPGLISPIVISVQEPVTNSSHQNSTEQNSPNANISSDQDISSISSKECVPIKANQRDEQYECAPVSDPNLLSGEPVHSDNFEDGCGSVVTDDTLLPPSDPILDDNDYMAEEIKELESNECELSFMMNEWNPPTPVLPFSEDSSSFDGRSFSDQNFGEHSSTHNESNFYPAFSSITSKADFRDPIQSSVLKRSVGCNTDLPQYVSVGTSSISKSVSRNLSNESSDDDFEDVQPLAMRIGKKKRFKNCLSTTSSSFALPKSRSLVDTHPRGIIERSSIAEKLKKYAFSSPQKQSSVDKSVSPIKTSCQDVGVMAIRDLKRDVATSPMKINMKNIGTSPVPFVLKEVATSPISKKNSGTSPVPCVLKEVATSPISKKNSGTSPLRCASEDTSPVPCVLKEVATSPISKKNSGTSPLRCASEDTGISPIRQEKTDGATSSFPSEQFTARQHLDENTLVDIIHEDDNAPACSQEAKMLQQTLEVLGINSAGLPNVVFGKSFLEELRVTVEMALKKACQVNNFSSRETLPVEKSRGKGFCVFDPCEFEEICNQQHYNLHLLAKSKNLDRKMCLMRRGGKQKPKIKRLRSHGRRRTKPTLAFKEEVLEEDDMSSRDVSSPLPLNQSNCEEEVEPNLSTFDDSPHLEAEVISGATVIQNESSSKTMHNSEQNSSESMGNRASITSSCLINENEIVSKPEELSFNSETIRSSACAEGQSSESSEAISALAHSSKKITQNCHDSNVSEQNTDNVRENSSKSSHQHLARDKHAADVIRSDCGSTEKEQPLHDLDSPVIKPVRRTSRKRNSTSSESSSVDFGSSLASQKIPLRRSPRTKKMIVAHDWDSGSKSSYQRGYRKFVKGSTVFISNESETSDQDKHSPVSTESMGPKSELRASNITEKLNLCMENKADLVRGDISSVGSGKTFEQVSLKINNKRSADFELKGQVSSKRSKRSSFKTQSDKESNSDLGPASIPEGEGSVEDESKIEDMEECGSVQLNTVLSVSSCLKPSNQKMKKNTGSEQGIQQISKSCKLSSPGTPSDEDCESEFRLVICESEEDEMVDKDLCLSQHSKTELSVSHSLTPSVDKEESTGCEQQSQTTVMGTKTTDVDQWKNQIANSLLGISSSVDCTDALISSDTELSEGEPLVADRAKRRKSLLHSRPGTSSVKVSKLQKLRSSVSKVHPLAQAIKPSQSLAVVDQCENQQANSVLRVPRSGDGAEALINSNTELSEGEPSVTDKAKIRKSAMPHSRPRTSSVKVSKLQKLRSSVSKVHPLAQAIKSSQSPLEKITGLNTNESLCFKNSPTAMTKDYQPDAHTSDTNDNDQGRTEANILERFKGRECLRMAAAASGRTAKLIQGNLNRPMKRKATSVNSSPGSEPSKPVSTGASKQPFVRPEDRISAIDNGSGHHINRNPKITAKAHSEQPIEQSLDMREDFAPCKTAKHSSFLIPAGTEFCTTPLTPMAFTIAECQSSKTASLDKNELLQTEEVVRETLKKFVVATSFTPEVLQKAITSLSAPKLYNVVPVLVRDVVKMMDDDCDTPPLQIGRQQSLAPPLTPVQQQLLTLVLQLSFQTQCFKDLPQQVLRLLEYRLFRLGKAPEAPQLLWCSRFYAAICRALCLRSQALIFCWDALYTLRGRSYTIVRAVVDVWPYLFPINPSFGKACPNSQVIFHLLKCHIDKDQDPNKPDNSWLRRLLRSTGLQVPSINSSILASNIFSGLKDGSNDSYLTAMILLAKREDENFTMRHIISGNLLPALDKWRSRSLGDEAGERIIWTISSILRALPPERNGGASHALLKLLRSELLQNGNNLVSSHMQEVIAIGLVLLSRHDIETVARTLMSWNPNHSMSKGYSPRLLQYLNSIVKTGTRPLGWWKKQLDLLPKSDPGK